MRRLFPIFLILLLGQMLVFSGPARAATDEANPYPLAIGNNQPPQTYPFVVEGDDPRVARARILTQTGDLDKAIALYEHILKDRPGDADILSLYVELLIDRGDYEKALTTLGHWLRADPASPDGLRLMGTLRARAGQYEESVRFYDSLLQIRSESGAALVDSAFTRQDAGDWSRAINDFSHALELDPDNADASEALRTLLLEHRPRLDMGVSHVDQTTGWYRLWPVKFSMHPDAPTRLELGVTMGQIHRKADDGAERVDRTVWDRWARVTRTVNQDWDVILGLGVHDDGSHGFAQEAGLGYRPSFGGQTVIMYERSKPYYDSVEGAARHMTFNRARFRYEGFFNDSWGMGVDAYVQDYGIDDGTDYGRRKGVEFALTKKISDQPGLYLTYSFLRTNFDYENDANTPVDFLKSEAVHTLSAFHEHSLTPFLGYTLSGGARKDQFKPQVTFFWSGGLIVKLHDRVEWRSGYEYTSDSGDAGGGISRTLNSSISIVF